MRYPENSNPQMDSRMVVDYKGTKGKGTLGRYHFMSAEFHCGINKKFRTCMVMMVL